MMHALWLSQHAPGHQTHWLWFPAFFIWLWILFCNVSPVSTQPLFSILTDGCAPNLRRSPQFERSECCGSTRSNETLGTGGCSPGSSCPHNESSLMKILNPNLLSMSRWVLLWDGNMEIRRRHISHGNNSKRRWPFSGSVSPYLGV